MTAKRIPLPVHSYVHLSKPVGVERMVNAYAEKQPPEGKSPTSVMRAPGTVLLSSPTPALGRGLFNWNETLYAVVGNSLYSISSSGGFSFCGTIAGTSQVSWGVNASQLVICASPDAYVWSGGTLLQVTDADYTSRGGGMVSSIDGYVVFTEPNTGRFFCSALNDASSYDALYFATAEGLPDNLVGSIADHRQLVLAGKQSMELWYNSGGTGFPFLRDTNGFIELGCAAGATLAKADNSVFWLASDLTVRRLSGITPVRVSQHGVEQAISSYTVSDAYAFSYTQDGHIFYVLTFPTSLHTWVYDVTTGEWHERESYGKGRWVACAAVSCYGRNFIMDYQNGQIGYLDSGTYTEFGNPLRAEWTFPVTGYSNGDLRSHQELDCLVETGVGLTSGQGSDPEIMLDVSNDDGRTWVAYPTVKLGKIGQYKTRVQWNRLGSSRNRIYRMAVSDPVKVVVSDAYLRVA